MSQPPDDTEDLALQALQRQLDDAFETTRPRPGFEDELWLRVQQSRPPQRRVVDALAAFFQGITEVPAVPLAAVAAVLVVLIGVGIFAYSGIGRGGGAGGGAYLSAGQSAPRNGELAPGTFGRVPTPVFGSGTKATAPQADTVAGAYLGPAQYTWAGALDVTVTSAPVFRYFEPSANSADQFASALGAVLRGRPAGFLGAYDASGYTLKVRGTVQTPPSSPAFFIFSSLTMPPIEAAGAGPQDVADIFLAQHSLVPQWAYTIAVDAGADPVKVRYQRQFEAPGYGTAFLVDFNGERYGLEVDLSGGNRPVLASGLLPLSLDVANYRIIAPSDAIQSAIASGASSSSATPAPAVKLTKAELVYVLVPAGDHSFYEPAYLFSGTLQMNGTTLTKRVLVPAVDPSQRKP
ncbi:MAG TPA: hypothetical protein VJP81_09545 [Candidatus Dormibacteraeota bacterium]|nr:hypothetical protein [Candidatus Dormibacteraeota bacterium]